MGQRLVVSEFPNDNPELHDGLVWACPTPCAPALPTLFARHPELELTLGSSDRPVDLLGEGVDCVIRGGDVHAYLEATVGDEGPDLAAVEDKIEMRKAEAMAKAELHEATPEGAEAELRKEINMSEANAKLDELRAELGI